VKIKHGLMIAGLLVGIWLAFFSDKSPEVEVVGAVAKTATAKITGSVSAVVVPTESSAVQAENKNYAKSGRVVPILALTARQKLISAGHVGLDGKKIAGNSAIFSTQSWVPPPPPVDPKLKNLPPPPPVAPPLNFTYLGSKQEAGVWEVYLARGETSYIVRTQDVIEGTYRVDSVTPNAIILTYLPLNQVQRLNIKG
jgi:hypothetical protein